ncbi:MAG TPA: alpha-1,2-fucosyltransferase [Gallionellaceae bacterium]
MKISDLIHRLKNRHKQQTVITFTGGMGAQIISAAIYFFLQDKGQEVVADLSYFDKNEKVARVGNKGEVSHWSWQLSLFGLAPDSFQSATNYSRRTVNLIEDGPVKSRLSIEALREPAIQARFALPDDCLKDLPLKPGSYLCIHVRRGDYVNVASHLVSDEEFFQIAERFKGLLNHLVVVSDSPIEAGFRERISASYAEATFLDNIDAFTTHCVMRKARILVCSNSQFSLIAALLNPAGLVVLPKQWFGPGDEALEAPIHSSCNFQILN